MATEWVCDGCGKRAQGFVNRLGQAFHPHDWYQRTDDDGTQVACSRACIETVAAKSGKTRVVLPI